MLQLLTLGAFLFRNEAQEEIYKKGQSKRIWGELYKVRLLSHWVVPLAFIILHEKTNFDVSKLCQIKYKLLSIPSSFLPQRNHDWCSCKHTTISLDNYVFFITCIIVTATLYTFIYFPSIFLSIFVCMTC